MKYNYLIQFFKSFKKFVKRQYKESNLVITDYREYISYYEEELLNLDKNLSFNNIKYYIGNDVVNLILDTLNINLKELVTNINIGNKFKYPNKDVIIYIENDNEKNIQSITDFALEHMCFKSFITEPLYYLFRWDDTKEGHMYYYRLNNKINSRLKLLKENNLTLFN